MWSSHLSWWEVTKMADSAWTFNLYGLKAAKGSKKIKLWTDLMFSSFKIN